LRVLPVKSSEKSRFQVPATGGPAGVVVMVVVVGWDVVVVVDLSTVVVVVALTVVEVVVVVVVFTVVVVVGAVVLVVVDVVVAALAVPLSDSDGEALDVVVPDVDGRVVPPAPEGTGRHAPVAITTRATAPRPAPRLTLDMQHPVVLSNCTSRPLADPRWRPLAACDISTGERAALRFGRFGSENCDSLDQITRSVQISGTCGSRHMGQTIPPRGRAISPLSSNPNRR
jgi:hypothetical protein